MIHSQDNVHLTCSRVLVAFVIYMDLSLGFVNTLIALLVVMGVMHEADNTDPIQSTWL